MEPTPHPLRLESLDREQFARLQGALEKVFDLSQEDSQKVLDTLLGGDPELRGLAEALLTADRALLESSDGMAAFLSSGVAADYLSNAGAESLDRGLIGALVGPYRIDREIGRGGMGRVYRAERADGQFEQTVAIKVLKRGVDTDEVLRRFLRERQILAKLEHPNIARLLDGGATEDGRPFLAMEFVEGVSITEWCRERNVSLTERLDLFVSICAAVQYAHRHLVVHRDLKPGNVLVTKEGNPKLLDFGIARLLGDETGSEEAQGNKLTRLDSLPLTPAYAAPEQLRGEDATTATDVYGLGMILYELLVGRRPYEVKGRSLEELRRQALERDPTSPSRASSVGRLRRALQGDLDAIVLTALATDPTRRYGSVEAYMEDLRRYRTHLPVRARRPSRIYRIRKLARRHAAAFAAGATLLALLVAYAGTTAVMLDRQRRERERAEIAARRAQRIQTFLTEMLTSAGPARLGEGTEQVGSSGPDPRVRDVLDRSADRAESELADDLPVLGAVEQAIGETYFALGVYDHAERHGRAAVSVRERLRDEAGVSESSGLLSQVLQRETRYDEALSRAKQVSSINLRLNGETSVGYALALQNESSILGSLGRSGEADERIAKAMRIGSRVFQPNDPRFIEILSSAAISKGRQRDPVSADSLYRDVLARVRHVYGMEHARTAMALSNLASNLLDLKRYAEAESVHREAFTMRRRLLGPEHPLVATSLTNIGYALREEGKFAEAESVLREALALRTRLLGPESRETLVSQSILANLLLRAGKPEEAEAIHRHVLVLRRRVLGPNHPLVATSLASLSDALLAQGKIREARSRLEEAIALREHILPPEHPDIAKAKARLASIQDGLWTHPTAATR